MEKFRLTNEQKANMTKSELAKAGKLEVTLKQWEEIYFKEMSICADLRNQDRAIQAFSMIIKIQGMMMELV